MKDNPVHKRKFAAFLSHAHADKDSVDRIENWLSTTAELPIWYDSKNLDASEMIATHLPKAIQVSRAMIIVLSESSIRSGWVEKEYNAAEVERASHSYFRIIPIKVDECEVPGFLRAVKWIDAVGGNLEMSSARLLLLSLYPGEEDIDLTKTRDIYTAAGWRQPETALNSIICQGFIKHGFRLIGDSPDQDVFNKETRLREIMKSCGGFLAILPDRGNGLTSKYIFQEIELAQKLGLHTVLFAAENVVLDKSLAQAKADGKVGNDFVIKENSILRIPNDLGESFFEEPSCSNALYGMVEEWRKPERLHYIFFAHGFETERKKVFECAQDIIQRVTGMPCTFGDEIRESELQEAIRNRIASAFVVIADISDDNVNSCIEAGLAQGAGAKLHIISRAPRKSPPFMFRDQQIFHYKNDVEMLGLIHKIVRPYRRRVINIELPKDKLWV